MYIEQKVIPSGRHVRWMAYGLLFASGCLLVISVTEPILLLAIVGVLIAGFLTFVGLMLLDMQRDEYTITRT